MWIRNVFGIIETNLIVYLTSTRRIIFCSVNSIDIQSRGIVLKVANHWNSGIHIYLKPPSTNDVRHNAPISALWLHAMAYVAISREFEDTKYYHHFK